jgi:hypothetical protein
MESNVMKRAPHPLTSPDLSPLGYYLFRDVMQLSEDINPPIEKHFFMRSRIF